MIEAKKLISKITRPGPDNSHRSSIYRFDRNERTTLFPEPVFQDMISNLTPYDFVAYGELEPFYEKLCAWLGVERENVLLTSGSDAGIKAIFETYIDKGDKVLLTLPNYAMFSVYIKMFGGIELLHWYDKDFKLNINTLLEKITNDIKMVIISNPGHTGKAVSLPDLLRIIEKTNRTNTLVLIDEAYHHFCPEPVTGYINQFPNLIICRTFSKAFGLASLRIGILIGCKELICELYKVKLVHEITGVAAKIGTYMLDHLNIVNDYVNDVNNAKLLLYRRLPNMGIQVYESESNFVFFKLPDNSNIFEFVNYLKTKNIYIKGPFNHAPFDNHIRVTVGDISQMNFFCDELDNFFS